MSEKDIKRAGDIAARSSVEEASAQVDYCVWMAGRYYDLLTPAQQTAVNNRAVKRVAGLKEGKPADLSPLRD